MDTDDLSEQTYTAVIVEADLFHHDLSIPYGLLAGHCKDDDDFLDQSASLTKSLLEGDQKELAEEIFFGEEVDLSAFRACLQRIQANINKVKKIPMAERTFEFYSFLRSIC